MLLFAETAKAAAVGYLIKIDVSVKVRGVELLI
jgi:hypothetical protein